MNYPGTAAAEITREGLESEVDGHYAYLKDLYRHFHANPELSTQEFETAARLADELRKAGFKVREKYGMASYAFAFHVSASLPAGKIGYVSGYAFANVDSVDIVVKGRGGHGAYPHQARDPVVLASQLVMSLQNIVSRETSPLEPVVVTDGREAE